MKRYLKMIWNTAAHAWLQNMNGKNTTLYFTHTPYIVAVSKATGPARVMKCHGKCHVQCPSSAVTKICSSLTLAKYR